MPCGKQQDIYMSYKLVQHLGIKHYEINIQRAVEAITESIAFLPEMTEQAQVNLPARVRMATLYAVSQSMNGRVANTCNLSEDWVGYATRYGDGAGDVPSWMSILEPVLWKILRRKGVLTYCMRRICLR